MGVIIVVVCTWHISYIKLSVVITKVCVLVEVGVASHSSSAAVSIESVAVT